MTDGWNYRFFLSLPVVMDEPRVAETGRAATTARPDRASGSLPESSLSGCLVGKGVRWVP